jgi:hypothetical protein
MYPIITPLPFFEVIFNNDALFLGSCVNILLYIFIFIFLFFIYCILGTLKLHYKYFYNAQLFQNNTKNSTKTRKFTILLGISLIQYTGFLRIEVFNAVWYLRFRYIILRYMTTPCWSNKNSKNTQIFTIVSILNIQVFSGFIHTVEHV